MIRSSGRWGAPARLRALVVLVVIALAMAAVRVAMIGSLYPLDYNEGWNALHAQIAAQGQPLYASPGGLTMTNYPPSSFYLVGLLGGIVPDLVVAGRIVSLVSLVIVGWCICRIIRALGARAPGALCGALLFALVNATAFRGYLATNDPQWLGHAFMVSGLLLLANGSTVGQARPLAVVGAAVLMVAGASVKHNIVAIPAAVTLWLLLHDRRAFLIWAVTGIAGIAALVVVDRLAFGGSMFPSVLSQPRTYSVMRAVGQGAVGLLFLPAAVLALKARPLIADRRYGLVLAGMAISAAIGFVQGAGAGVDINAWFELLIFASIAFGMAMPALAGHQRFTRLFHIGIAPLIALVPFGLYLVADEAIGRTERIAQTEAIVGEVSRVDGKVACDALAYCYWAGKGYSLDMFHVSQMAAVSLSSAELNNRLAAGNFAAFLLHDREGEAPPGPVQAFVQQHYRPISRQGGMVLYVRI